MPEIFQGALTVVYLAVVLFTIIRIILDTESSSKTLAYIMLVIFVPVAGIVVYFSFGVNYRHRKLDARRTRIREELGAKFTHAVKFSSAEYQQELRKSLGYFDELSRMMFSFGGESLTWNATAVLNNGEAKFPDVLASLEAARDHIHIEYYTWENDITGNLIKDVLIRKAKEGLEVRVLYDDYGSRGIRRNVVRELRAAGVLVFPVIKVYLILLANRLNHRDHRKIIVIDGRLGYVGGINISDRYDNSIETGLYWRDTHLKIEGPAVLYLQRHFLSTWNDVEDNWIPVSDKYFPQDHNKSARETELVQLIGGGPIFKFSTIMLTYMKLFNDARETLYITNPYFIPSESILNVLKQSALSGVDVRLLIPGKSDSWLVSAASRFYFRGLLEAGVRIFKYGKGFVHAKTVVADGKVSVIGTANLDNRSFDLNYEIMAVCHGEKLANNLTESFFADLSDSEEIRLEEWRRISIGKRLVYGLARLVSSLL